MPEQTMADFILERIAEREGRPVRAETRLEATALDSLDLVELILDVEERFDVSIDDLEATPATVGDFIRHCEQRGSDRE